MTERLPRGLSAGNAARFLLSFLIAFTLWAWVTKQNDPDRTYHATDASLSVNVPAGLQVVNTLPNVDITLKGPRSVIQRIETGSVQAVVDLNDVTAPGSYTRDVVVEGEPDGLRASKADPSTVTVQLDTVVSQQFSVEVLPAQSLPRNLSVTSASTSPDSVTVTGVQQNVDRVDKVVVDLDIAGHDDSFNAQVKPRAVDAAGAEVENVTVEPDTVTLSVSLTVRGKVIPVFVQCACDAAQGFEVVGQPMPTPATVLVDGPKDSLAKVQYIFTTPIDTSNLKSTTVLPNVPLDTNSLPDDITIERTTVDVSVRIEQSTFQKTFDAVAVKVINAPPGAQVSANPSSVSLTVVGPQEEINALVASDVAVIVDASGLGPGTHSVVPGVLLPPRLTYNGPLPATTVTIAMPTPTPAPTPTATAPPAPTNTPAVAPTP